MTGATQELLAAAIEAIASIITTVRNARDGKIDPGVALTAIATLHASLAANNDAADRALDKRFDPAP